MAKRQRTKIKRSEIDFLLLAVFGPRYLPDDVAARVALRRELARGLADAFDRHPDLGLALQRSDRRLAIPEAGMEAVAAVG